MTLLLNKALDDLAVSNALIHRFAHVSAQMP
jgi:hypothetical protein